MTDLGALETLLSKASVGDAVFDLRPDYRAMLVAVGGLVPQASGPEDQGLLEEATIEARQAIGDARLEELPHVAAWREAYRAFGAKPQRTRNSLEALLRRASTGLPR